MKRYNAEYEGTYQEYRRKDIYKIKLDNYGGITITMCKKEYNDYQGKNIIIWELHCKNTFACFDNEPTDEDIDNFIKGL